MLLSKPNIKAVSILLFILIILVSSCSKSNKDKLTGVWERIPQSQNDKYLAYSFEEDGSVLKVFEDGKKQQFGLGASYDPNTEPIKMEVKMMPDHTSKFIVNFIDDNRICIRSENPSDIEVIFTRKNR